MKKTPIDLEASAAWCSAFARFDEDLRRRGANEKTRLSYAADVRQFAVWASWQSVEPPQVTGNLLRRFDSALTQRGSSPVTVARKLAALRSFFGTLRQHGEIPANPVDRPATSRAQKIPAVLSAEQVSRLLDRIAARTPLELRDRALFEIAYSSGLCAQDLAALDVASIDFDAAQLRVESKGSKIRSVAAGEPALQAMARYLQRARGALAHDDHEPALFLSKTGRRLSTSDVRRRLRVWERHAAAQGGGHPQVLRHAFAGHLMAVGADQRTIQELLRQTSVSTTQTYTRVESARLKAAYARAHPRA
ncbi:MAG TPA: tyrosine-type recombinase/integrase [Solirubrobacteraceae bacterium]